jgi:rfaE bifunctional protein kinase chain/domain
VQYESETSWSGGAAVVSKHMRSTGADVTFTTVLGNDPLKDFVINDLKEAGVKVNAIVDKTRPTTQKQSILCQNYQLLRVGKLDNRTISDKIASEMAGHIADTRADACVFSDFRHGIFNRKTIPALSAKIPTGALKIADSQVASRWGNILEFHGFDLITPNEREARFALGDQDSVVRPLGTNLYNKAECKYLILTLGDRGIMTFREESAGMKQFFTVDSFAEKVVDAVGAGDALLSYASLTLTATKSISMASIIGSFAAAVACGNEGNTPVTPRDILSKIDSVQKACV